MTCPKCSEPLEQTTYAEIEVDRCMRCAGIWFDSLEAEMLKTIQGSESLDVGAIDTNSQLDARDRDLLCPRCRVPMLRMLDIDRHKIWYERCPKCQGMWLDAGEFKQFKQNFRSRSSRRDRFPLPPRK
ncbi:MAG: zf-TFIIB domain-containing protein [Cyanobacteriota bacterium]|nr:zf-TFIIB domain-containing protein [Cyanobacteriota bacterium]